MREPGGDAGRSHLRTARAEAVAVAHERRVGGEGDGSAGQAAAFSGSAGGNSRVDAPGDEAGGGLGGRDKADIDPPAAATHRFDDHFWRGGDKAEHGVPGRLFQRLEDCMGGLAAQAVGGFYQHHPGAGLEREAGYQVDEAAHLADTDVARIGGFFVRALARLGAAERIARPEVDDIGMGAFGDEPAGTADSTGNSRRGGGGLTVEEAGVFERQEAAARTFCPGEEQSVRWVFAGSQRLQFTDDGFMADDGAHGARVQEGGGRREEGGGGFARPEACICQNHRHDVGRPRPQGADLQELTGGEAVAHTLRALGVEHVFGIVSVHNIPIYDAINRMGGITAVAVRHEQGAVHAADGYARATGRLGVAITSTGPGAANAMGGLFEAGFSSSRVLMITGQVESRYYGKGKGSLHEAENQVPMLRAVTRRVESVRLTRDIPAAITRVAADVMTGRPQPGAIEIPVDFQYAKADFDIPHIEGWPRVAPDKAGLAAAAGMLSAARRPVIWAGGGVLTAGAESELQQLAELLGAPVVTSLNGRGAIPEDHPLALGPLTAHPAVEAVIAGADVVLAVGTRFQGGATRNWALKMPGQLIHLDAGPEVIGRNYTPALSVVGDARPGLAGILKLVTGSAVEAGFAERASAARDEAHAAIRGDIGPDYAAIMDAMREALPRNGLVVRDPTVPAYLWGNRIFPIYEPRTSLYPSSAAIGPALPLAIGASIGTGRPAVVIQGDGGFMLNIAELATAVQYRVPVVVCVFNDRGYGVLRSIQARTFEGRQTGVDLATPDFAALAKAMGLPGETVSGVDEFRVAIGRAMAAGGPYLLDIDMDVLKPMAGFGRR